MSNNDIQENVCKFYLEHKNDCDALYNEAEDINISRIYEYVSDSTAIENQLLPVSLIVLTANKYEKNILHYQIFKANQSKIKKFKIELFPSNQSKGETYGYLFKWEKYSILHIEALSTGSYTIGGAADIIRYVINHKHIFPTAIVSLGICFGTNEEKNKLGDVVISKKIYPYFIGSKIGASGYYVNDDNTFRINSKIDALIRSAKDENAFSMQKMRLSSEIILPEKQLSAINGYVTIL